MPTETSLVGPQTIPVPIGGTDSDLEDPTLLGVLDFAGYLIKQALDAKLGEMGGPTTSAAISDACPTAHRFPWDHAGSFVRTLPATGALPLPGLWAWETAGRATEKYATMLYGTLERDITVQYIFPAVDRPNGMLNRHGLLSTLGRVFARMAERGRHPSYSYDGAPLGEPLRKSIGAIRLDFVGGTPGYLSPVPSNSSQSVATRGVALAQQVFPAYQARFTVWERIEPRDYVEPDDIMSDGSLILSVGDTPGGDTLDILERVLEPDNG